MTIAERLRQEGHQIGWQEGKIEGWQEGKLEGLQEGMHEQAIKIALRMLELMRRAINALYLVR